MQNIYAHVEDRPVSQISVGARAAFIVRTYLHLFGAVLAFTLLEAALFSIPAGAEGGTLASVIASAMLGTSPLFVFGGLVVVTWLFSSLAHRSMSVPLQYLALGGFVLAETLFVLPLLYLAFNWAPGAITSAAAVTLGGFALLTFIVFWTRKDFSFLGAALRWIMLGAIALIVVSLFTGFQLGLWFNAAMVVVAGLAILWDTSNVLHHYPEDRHVSAALELFASIVMLFWYVLRLFISRD